MSKLLVIESDVQDAKGKAKPFKKKVVQKSRSFRAIPLHYVSWDITESRSSRNADTIRPVLLTYGSTEQENRMFTANLRTGKIAQLQTQGYYRTEVDGKFEVLKSAGYRWINQKVNGVAGSNGETVVVTTVYNPDLFTINPGMTDPMWCTFLSAPPKWWVERETASLMEDKALCQYLSDYIEILELPGQLKMKTEEIIKLAPQACYAFAYMSERNAVALPGGIEFQLQVYINALRQGVFQVSNASREKYSWATSRHSWYYQESGTEEVYAMIVSCRVEQESLNSFLDSQCEVYGSAIQALDMKRPELKEERERLRRLQIEEAASAANMARELPDVPDLPALPAVTINEMLDAIDEDNLQEEIDSGYAVGNEVIEDEEPVAIEVGESGPEIYFNPDQYDDVPAFTSEPEEVAPVVFGGSGIEVVIENVVEVKPGKPAKKQPKGPAATSVQEEKKEVKRNLSKRNTTAFYELEQITMSFGLEVEEVDEDSEQRGAA